MKLVVDFDRVGANYDVSEIGDLSPDAVVMGCGLLVGRALSKALFEGLKEPLTSITVKGTPTVFYEYFEEGWIEKCSELFDDERVLSVRK